MVHESLNEVVSHRLEELGLPASLNLVPEFHQKLLDGWVMFVRDSASEHITDVHMFEPRHQKEVSRHV